MKMYFWDPDDGLIFNDSEMLTSDDRARLRTAIWEAAAADVPLPSIDWTRVLGRKIEIEFPHLPHPD